MKYMTNQLIELSNCLFQLLIMGVLKVFLKLLNSNLKL